MRINRRDHRKQRVEAKRLAAIRPPLPEGTRQSRKTARRIENGGPSGPRLRPASAQVLKRHRAKAARKINRPI